MIIPLLAAISVGEEGKSTLFCWINRVSGRFGKFANAVSRIIASAFALVSEVLRSRAEQTVDEPGAILQCNVLQCFAMFCNNVQCLVAQASRR